MSCKFSNSWQTALLRIGDVYPDNMVQLAVRMYLYRWNDRLQEDATTAPYEARSLLCPVTSVGKSRNFCV